MRKNPQAGQSIVSPLNIQVDAEEDSDDYDNSVFISTDGNKQTLTNH